MYGMEPSCCKCFLDLSSICVLILESATVRLRISYRFFFDISAMYLDRRSELVRTSILFRHHVSFPVPSM